jgi:hypothetical protein|tara:strand:- start:202 stop:450 length:249 start_codon:yes stop_codon:yes gene_type:complete
MAKANQVINFFVKGIQKTTISHDPKVDSNGKSVEGVRWFAARYEVATKECYFLRDGGLTKGSAITLTDSYETEVLAMPKSTI